MLLNQNSAKRIKKTNSYRRCYTYDNTTSRTAISPTQLANEPKPPDVEENGDVKLPANVQVNFVFLVLDCME